MEWWLLDMRQTVGDHNDRNLSAAWWMQQSVHLKSCAQHLTVKVKDSPLQGLIHIFMEEKKCLGPGQSNLGWNDRLIFKVQPPK